MNVRRFVGQITAVALGVMLYRAVVAIYHGNRDAAVALVAVLGVGVLVAVAFWGYMGDDA